jgi:hypothetical protein
MAAYGKSNTGMLPVTLYCHVVGRGTKYFHHGVVSSVCVTLYCYVCVYYCILSYIT